MLLTKLTTVFVALAKHPASAMGSGNLSESALLSFMIAELTSSLFGSSCNASYNRGRKSGYAFYWKNKYGRQML